MTKLLLSLLFIGSFSALATSHSIVCDKASIFGGMKRIELDHIEGVQWELAAYKVKSCGQDSGCSYLDLKFKTTVSLMESPSSKNTIISIPHLNHDIKVSINNKRCKVKIPSKGYRFTGKRINHFL